MISAADPPARRRPGTGGTETEKSIEALKEKFEKLSLAKRVIITDKIGSLDDMLKRPLMHSINGSDNSKILEDIVDETNNTRLIYTVFNRDGVYRQTTTFKYKMTRQNISGIAGADVTHESEELASFAKHDAAPEASAARSDEDLSVAAPEPQPQRKIKPSRVNKIQLGAWIDPEYKRHLLMVKVKDPSRTTESLVKEALDDLFAKHDVPPVPAVRKKAKSFTHGD